MPTVKSYAEAVSYEKGSQVSAQTAIVDGSKNDPGIALEGPALENGLGLSTPWSPVECKS